MTNSIFKTLYFFGLLFLAQTEVAYAYVGPGAGIALVGSSAVLILAILFGIVGLLLLPFRAILRSLKYKRIFKNAKLKRLIILGFDGMDPKITEAMLQAGELPNLSQLKQEGTYSTLKSTIPSMSPVAWSTFQTGVNPGAHNVFDFLTRDKRTYFPGMVSVDTVTKIKRFLWKKKKVSEAVLTRKSKPFWKILGDAGFYSSIIRVPISYPPEPLKGNILSAMCTPDIRGSQGSFMYCSSAKDRLQQSTNGDFELLKSEDGAWIGELKGPQVGDKYATVKFSIKAKVFRVQKEKVQLEIGQFTRWIRVVFNVEGRQVNGIFRLRLDSLEPELSLYVSPINVDPENPALQISYPSLFSRWLAKTIGSFGTLGFLEDTWGRNEFALDDQAFLDQLYLNQEEREKMLFENLARLKRGLCVCVFDGTDRVQHMFWRYRDKEHPAPKQADSNKFERAIEDVYQRMDYVVAKVKAEMQSGDELIVLSDHGFGSFRRCVNLNYWLMQNGYLVLKVGASGKSLYLVDVDWSKTRAFSLGITGIYINKQGRESKGIVTESEYKSICSELAAKLEQLRDGEAAAVKKVFIASEVYKGLYAADAPDLIMGYSNGYRVSWESVTGSVEEATFSDNLKAWSGDHHIFPDDVPGVIFSTLKLRQEDPKLIDLAPTVLNLFGIKAPAYMEGKSLV
jgi:predicted AlkP superfamily phosphohydrolase/phosphomutase